MNKRADRQQEIIADEQIIELYWQREERAIKETDVKYGQFLFRIAYNILHDRSDSEECQNDTYLGIWNAIPPTRPVVFPAFITQIMRRTAIDRYKEKTSKKRIPSELTVSLEELDNTLHSSESVCSECEAKELGKIISDYLRGLFAANIVFNRKYFSIRSSSMFVIPSIIALFIRTPHSFLN